MRTPDARPTTERRGGLDISPIQALLALIVERCRPDSIWLFGSRAKGTARNDSDWDLLVTLPDSVPFEQHDVVIDPIHLRKLSGTNADILSCGATEFDAATSIPNTLAYEIARTGFPIYEH
jgi:predicted nucleotidyltransferase